MAKQLNPFRTSMVRMRGPHDSGDCISVAGFTLFADEDGTFEVPQNIARELQHHGFTEAPAAAVAVAEDDGKGKKT